MRKDSIRKAKQAEGPDWCVFFIVFPHKLPGAYRVFHVASDVRLDHPFGTFLRMYVPFNYHPKMVVGTYNLVFPKGLFGP